MKPYTDLMIDLETLDTHPNGVVIQIGWAFFNAGGTRPMYTRSWWPNVEEQQGLGRTIDFETVKWWNQQPNFLDQLVIDRNMALQDIMHEMADVWESAAYQGTRVWAKGVSFDIGMWRTFLPEFWQFRDVHCLRTLKLVGDRMGITVEQANDNPHDAVADAVAQAKQVQALCSILKRD